MKKKYLSFILVVAFSLGFVVNSSENITVKYNSEMPQSWQMPDSIYDVLKVVIDKAPEIQDERIKVKVTKIKTTMSLRPTLWSLFIYKKENRKYILRINNSNKKGSVIYKDVPHNARIGLLAHEMMHIIDFSERNFFGVLSRGAQYLSVKGKTQYEYEIDKMVINIGLGEYLHSWSDYVLNHSKATEKYKEFKRTVYMTPCQIEEKLERILD